MEMVISGRSNSMWKDTGRWKDLKEQLELSPGQEDIYMSQSSGLESAEECVDFCHASVQSFSILVTISCFLYRKPPSTPRACGSGMSYLPTGYSVELKGGEPESLVKSY